MKTLISIVTLMLFFVLGAASFGAEPVHLILTGQAQGVIQGESSDNTIEAIAYTHMLIGEPNPDNGITGTVRDHFPIAILKKIDKSSPRLFKAWCTHERLQAVFKFYRPTSQRGRHNAAILYGVIA